MHVSNTKSQKPHVTTFACGLLGWLLLASCSRTQEEREQHVLAYAALRQGAGDVKALVMEHQVTNYAALAGCARSNFASRTIHTSLTRVWINTNLCEWATSLT